MIKGRLSEMSNDGIYIYIYIDEEQKKESEGKTRVRETVCKNKVECSDKVTVKNINYNDTLVKVLLTVRIIINERITRITLT